MSLLAVGVAPLVPPLSCSATARWRIAGHGGKIGAVVMLKVPLLGTPRKPPIPGTCRYKVPLPPPPPPPAPTLLVMSRLPIH